MAGWLPLTASKCQDVTAVRRSRANRSHHMEITSVSLDLTKSIFEIHAADAAGADVVRKAVRRSQVLPFFTKLPSCLVGIEAYGTSHHWARELGKLGHEVRLMPPAYVKPSACWRRSPHGLCRSLLPIERLGLHGRSWRGVEHIARRTAWRRNNLAAQYRPASGGCELEEK